MLLDTELQEGYWRARHIAEAFPDSISSPEEYSGQETLCLRCTQLNASPTEQRKLVKSWCSVLPTLPVKTLMFNSKVNQALFDAATKINGLEALSTEWGSIKSIASIENCSSLIALNIGSNPSLTGLKKLAVLPKLRVLHIENVKEAHDLSFASKLTQLKELGINGSMWTDQKVDNLWPLKHLQQLEVLWLIGAKVVDDGLLPLHELKKLKKLQCSFDFRASEFEALRNAVPTLKYGSAFDYDAIKNFCKP